MPSSKRDSLTDVLMTADLGNRPVRPIQSSFMNSVIVDLEYQIADDPLNCMQGLARAVMELTGAQSSGVSLLDHNKSKSSFKWYAVSGKWKEYSGHVLPGDAIPCGVAFARKALQLFARPERCFSVLRAFTPPVAEGMYAPFDDGAQVRGVVWGAFHRKDLQFDAQDAFMLQELARLAPSVCRRMMEECAREK